MHAMRTPQLRLLCLHTLDSLPFDALGNGPPCFRFGGTSRTCTASRQVRSRLSILDTRALRSCATCHAEAISSKACARQTLISAWLVLATGDSSAPSGLLRDQR